MIIVLGLLILAAAAVAGVAGFFTNNGAPNALDGSFSLFGYHVTGSTGTLFVFGLAVGAIAMLGLSLLLAGARRTSRRGRDARHALQHSQHENAAATEYRDDLVHQRDSARAEAESVGHERDDLTRQRNELTRQRDDLVDQRNDLVDQRGPVPATSPGDSARARQREREEVVQAREAVGKSA